MRKTIQNPLWYMYLKLHLRKKRVISTDFKQIHEIASQLQDSKMSFKLSFCQTF